jgi:hypothetical protein
LQHQNIKAGYDCNIFCLFVSEIDGDDFVAQAFGFLIASFETSATSMSYAFYELALHPEIQHRLKTEITQVLDKNEGDLTYDGIQEMSYLDMVVRAERTEVGYILRIVIFWIVKLHIQDREWKRYVLTERWYIQGYTLQSRRPQSTLLPQ